MSEDYSGTSRETQARTYKIPEPCTLCGVMTRGEAGMFTPDGELYVVPLCFSHKRWSALRRIEKFIDRARRMRVYAVEDVT